MRILPLVAREVGGDHGGKSTLAFWTAVEQAHAEMWASLQEALEGEELDNSRLVSLLDDAVDASKPLETRRRYALLIEGIRSYLNRLERLAVSCELKVFDVDVIDALANTHIRDRWRYFSPYVEYIRRKAPTGRQYDALERLVRELTERYEERRRSATAGVGLQFDPKEETR